MKVTVNWVGRHFPFLSQLLEKGKVGGRKKLTLVVKVEAVNVVPPYHDGVCRFTAMGKIGGDCFTHFTGSDASIANNSAEMLPESSRMQGLLVNPGCFYAILDVLEYYGYRELTVYFSPCDIKNASRELKNQLTELHLQLATTA